MEIGKTTKIHKNLPDTFPIKITRKNTKDPGTTQPIVPTGPKEEPIRVPEWPVRKKEEVKVNK